MTAAHKLHAQVWKFSCVWNVRIGNDNHVSSEIGAGAFSSPVSFIDFKQRQNDALSGFSASSSSWRVFSSLNSFLFESSSFL